MPHSGAKLFQPIRVGNCELSHRVVLAPLTRYCADDAHVPTDLMVEYYAQRACIPGTLAITEATFIAPKAGGYDNAPGIWSDEQVDAWKKVVDAVHAQGSYIFMQLWQLGRTAMPEILSLPDCPKNPGGPYPFVSSSAVAMPERRDGPLPRPLEHEEILEYIEIFGKAAHNAVHRAGFDGVEIHAAHGYLLDQFLQDTCNKRTDQWGGSIENRTRFAWEVVKKVVSVVGEERTGIRITPFNTMQGMHMEHPQPTFAHLVSRIREAYPRFAYLHTVEPRISGYFDREVQAWESNDFLRSIWKSPDSEKNVSAFLSAGGYIPENALKDAEEKGDLIVFGRYYIPNPDLPARIRKEIPFTPYDRSKFYISGVTAEGYIDYTFADAETQTLYNTKREVRVRAQIKNQTVANIPGEA
ncbi:NADH:flavin oxidoreductase/NADH oxidase [Sanghuangporus baumii]|uniref:NADH:flavin oxidoreductase/NADH oxidase n=1 Tax=Sanghuangporus baumii TaxID=108892 RepID=A0A9Q5NEM1_SANBA|nr:NADH:flavin oxidoreductase/NADH oxidase [Sanghuangporus baumii]